MPRWGSFSWFHGTLLSVLEQVTRHTREDCSRGKNTPDTAPILFSIPNFLAQRKKTRGSFCGSQVDRLENSQKFSKIHFPFRPMHHRITHNNHADHAAYTDPMWTSSSSRPHHTTRCQCMGDSGLTSRAGSGNACRVPISTDDNVRICFSPAGSSRVHTAGKTVQKFSRRGLRNSQFDNWHVRRLCSLSLPRAFSASNFPYNHREMRWDCGLSARQMNFHHVFAWASVLLWLHTALLAFCLSIIVSVSCWGLGAGRRSDEPPTGLDIPDSSIHHLDRKCERFRPTTRNSSKFLKNAPSQRTSVSVKPRNRTRRKVQYAVAPYAVKDRDFYGGYSSIKQSTICLVYDLSNLGGKVFFGYAEYKCWTFTGH